MNILVGWDKAEEAELISLYLNVDDNVAEVTTDPASFLEAAGRQDWDIVLMPLTFPDADQGFQTFTRVKSLLPETPIIGGARPMEVYELSRFVANGLQQNIQRDDAGNFLFLLLPTLESTFKAANAERSRKLAERLREEIESVRRLQESVIPRDLHAPAGYEIAARYETSQIKVLGNRPVVMAGGDYYDVFSMNPDELVLLVGDASGHGMKACMSIMTMHTLIRMIREHRYKDTAEFVAEVNDRLCEQQIIRDEGGFITLLYCVLNTATNTLQWTSAGHQMPLLQDLGTNQVRQLGTDEDGGLPLGIAGGIPYDKLQAPVPENSRVLLYTDGIVEAFPEGKEEHSEFGVEGVIKTLQETAHEPVERALDRLFVASQAFTQGAGRHDDTSLVLLERKAAGR